MNKDRRTILTGAAAALVAVPTIAMAQHHGETKNDPAAMPMPDVSGTRTHQQFAMGVIGPAELSLATSKIAVDRARKADALEFAGFELTEAIAVTTVLKQLGTKVPPMDAKAKAILAEIRAAAPGAAFDIAYIDAQYENHVFLRDLAKAYLGNSPENPDDMAEMQGRHLATLALATFEEHVLITRRIARELQA